MTDQQLLESFPWIPWETPIKIRITDGRETFACRVCAAHNGVRASEVVDGRDSEEDIIAHIAREHPVVAASVRTKR